jgi:hypothetical protein
MKKAWLVWWIVTLILSAYCLTGFVASYPNRVDIKLEAGAAATLTLVRLAEDHLRMELLFRGDHRERPELGDYTTQGDWNRTGLLEFAQPGSAIRIVASKQKTDAVLFEAMPKEGWGVDIATRRLTSNLPVGPGVWRWPEQTLSPQLVLQPGFNTVTLEVRSVEPPLVGETVQLIAQPPLGFKSSQPSVSWLWAWFLWPAALCVQAAWASGLHAAARRKSRHTHGRLHVDTP